MDKAANDNRVTELISILSTTLADVDVEYDFELARIRVTAKPNLRAMIVDTRHFLSSVERRAPYVRQIAELRERCLSGIGPDCRARPAARWERGRSTNTGDACT